VVSCSSNDPLRLSFYAFTVRKPEWIATTKDDCWIQVKCPEAVRLHKFVLRGRRSGVDRIYSWQLEASDDAIKWETLYNNTFIGNTTQFFSPQ